MGFFDLFKKKKEEGDISYKSPYTREFIEECAEKAGVKFHQDNINRYGPGFEKDAYYQPKKDFSIMILTNRSGRCIEEKAEFFKDKCYKMYVGLVSTFLMAENVWILTTTKDFEGNFEFICLEEDLDKFPNIDISEQVLFSPREKTLVERVKDALNNYESNKQKKNGMSYLDI